MKKMNQYPQLTIEFDHFHQAVRTPHLHTREHSINKTNYVQSYN